MTLRLAPTVYRVIKDAADNAGLPVSTYVREAALIRAAYELGVSAGVGRIGEPDPRTIEPIRDIIIERIREWLENDESPPGPKD